MASERRFPVMEVEPQDSAASWKEPNFSALEHEPVLRRLATNLTAAVSAPSPSVPKWSWAHAPMFRSAYFRKRYPLRALLTSVLLHVSAVSALISLPDFSASNSRLAMLETSREERRIIYYTKADFLPPISPPKREARAARPRAAESPRVQIRLALHPVQEIVSQPPAADNRRQTIVQPQAPSLEIRTEIRVPNLVSWMPQLVPPAPSASEARRALTQIRVPALPAPNVAVLRPMPSPPKLATLNADAANVPVAPTPAMEIPKLPVPVKIAPPRPRPREAVTKPAPEPRAAPAPPQIGVEANAPMPSLAADLVAVSLAPAPPEEEIVVPRGSRAGEFHASPEGTGTESGPVPVHSEVVATSAETPASELPNRELADIRVPGLSVSGSAPPPPGIIVENRSEEDFKKLLAKAGRPSLIPEMPHARPLESEFFGSRRVYTTYLNMPNLASGSGSWVLRFAELDADEPAPGGGSELSTPEAIRKVDPMYVAAAARERVQGTVLLAALILKDGSVANIRVVRSLDARLDSSAVSALTQWHFRPATRNGAPVDLEVLVQIPFRLPSF